MDSSGPADHDFVDLVIQRPQLISVLVEDGLLQLLVFKQDLHQTHSSFELACARVTMALRMPLCMSNVAKHISRVQVHMKTRQQVDIKM